MGLCNPAESMGLEVSVVDQVLCWMVSLGISVRRVAAQTLKVLEQGYAVCGRAISIIQATAPSMSLGPGRD